MFEISNVLKWLNVEILKQTLLEYNNKLQTIFINHLKIE